MTVVAGHPKVANLADLFAVAYQIEADAVERYDLLADQMATHNNPELVAVFEISLEPKPFTATKFAGLPAISTWSRTHEEWQSGIEAKAQKRPVWTMRTI